jgi:hypothetical protein
MTSLVLFLLFILGYIVLYLGGRKYLETFDNRFNADGSPNQVVMPEIQSNPEKPYLMDNIDELDDYEVSAIFQRQGSRSASQKDINDAMTRYPLDWAAQGQGSQYFQEKQLQFQKDAPNMIPGDDGQPQYVDISKDEKDILQTYEPKSSKSLLEYNLEDVKHLVDRVYAKRDQIPVLKKSKQGNNIWEITEVMDKNPVIEWEDDPVRDSMTKRGEEMITIPSYVRDAEMDPFMKSNDSTRKGKNSYLEWTPGLERMFAPSKPEKRWY